MKICFVNLASGYSGGENQTYLLAQELTKKNLDIVAVNNPKSELTNKLKKIGIDTIDAKNLWSSHFSKKIKDVDLFHAHDGRAVHWCSLHNAIFGSPFVVTRRIDNEIRDNFFTKKSYSRASHLIGLSSRICTVLHDYVPEKKVTKIPSSPVVYPTNLETISKIRDTYRNKFIVIHAASLLKHKGQDLTIEAARMLDNEEVVFLILGDGSEKDYLEKLAKDQNNVFLLGKQKNMGDWLAVADCLILPSRNEGLGSVLLEAMTAGTPVIASDVGGIPDIVHHGETGLLVASDNAKELANSVMLLKNNSELKNELIRNARRYVKDLEIEVTANKYLEIYKSIASHRK